MTTGSPGKRPQVPERNQQQPVLAQKGFVNAVSWQTSSMEKRPERLYRKDRIILISVIIKMSEKKIWKINRNPQLFEEAQNNLMGEEMIILAYQMPIKQQDDTVMKNSDVFPEGVEQNISRRENGVLKPLYKILEKT